MTTTMSRLEARLVLESALELRNPRLILKKPTLNGIPADLYALHQAILRFGGYRQVRTRRGMRRPWDRALCGGFCRQPVRGLMTVWRAERPVVALHTSDCSILCFCFAG